LGERVVRNDEVSGSIPLGSTRFGICRESAHAGLQTAIFCASGAHDQQVAARRFSKLTIFGSA
jgi:hypothetical protein